MLVSKANFHDMDIEMHMGMEADNMEAVCTPWYGQGHNIRLYQ